MSLAFVFPGQGSQAVGMLDAFAADAAVQAVLRDADAALGEPLSATIAQGPADQLNLTVNYSVSDELRRRDLYGQAPIDVKFINDNDTVIIKGFCKNNEIRIGFGEVSSKLLPPFVRK